MYEKVAEYFSVLSRTELITCSASQTSYAKIKEQAQTVSCLIFIYTHRAYQSSVSETVFIIKAIVSCRFCSNR